VNGTVSSATQSRGPLPLPGPLSEIPPRASLRYSERYSEQRFDSLRRIGDPLADTIVETVGREAGLDRYPDLLAEVKKRAAAEGGIYQRFLDACSEVPSWVDFSELDLAARMLAGFPVHTGLSLFSASLVGGAVFQKMALITAMTGMLSGDGNRRLRETAVMVLQMALPGTMRPGADGHELLIRVRLLHAAIRHHLRQSGRFDHPEEVPVNQHDLAITLGLLSYLNVRSLARLGIHFRDDELAAYNTMWRYAGHVIGIGSELLPVSIEDQREFFYASLIHQARPEKFDPRTKRVMDNLARDASKMLPVMSYRAAQQFLYRSCRYLSGDEYVVGMELPSEGGRIGLAIMRFTGSLSHFIWQHVPGGDLAMQRLGMWFYRKVLRRLGLMIDHDGEYRVRTVEHAAVSTSRSDGGHSTGG
jgi:hypothetical protein